MIEIKICKYRAPATSHHIRYCRSWIQPCAQSPREDAVGPRQLAEAPSAAKAAQRHCENGQCWRGQASDHRRVDFLSRFAAGNAQQRQTRQAGVHLRGAGGPGGQAAPGDARPVRRERRGEGGEWKGEPGRRAGRAREKRPGRGGRGGGLCLALGDRPAWERRRLRPRPVLGCFTSPPASGRPCSCTQHVSSSSLESRLCPPQAAARCRVRTASVSSGLGSPGGGGTLLASGSGTFIRAFAQCHRHLRCDARGRAGGGKGRDGDPRRMQALSRLLRAGCALRSPHHFGFIHHAVAPASVLPGWLCKMQN